MSCLQRIRNFFPKGKQSQLAPHLLNKIVLCAINLRETCPICLEMFFESQRIIILSCKCNILVHFDCVENAKKFGLGIKNCIVCNSSFEIVN